MGASSSTVAAKQTSPSEMCFLFSRLKPVPLSATLSTRLVTVVLLPVPQETTPLLLATMRTREPPPFVFPRDRRRLLVLCAEPLLALLPGGDVRINLCSRPDVPITSTE